MTNQELKSALMAMDVQFANNATNAALQSLYDNAIAAQQQEAEAKATTYLGEEGQDYEIANARITDVLLPQEAEGRVTLVLDKEFITIDQRTGVAKVTNKLGIHNYNLLQQLTPFVPELKLAKVKAMGRTINPQVYALALCDAVVTISREWKTPNDTRFNTDERYSSNVFVSKITACKPHISALFGEELREVMRKDLVIIERTASANFDNF